MKNVYSFLAGVTLVSLCVVATRSLPGYMFALGFALCAGSVILLHFKGIIRLVPYCAARSGGSRRSSVYSSEVLPTVQQDVLSALLNLRVPFSDAEGAVRSAAKEHGGESFDSLFRTALNLVNAGAGKSRRAAA